MCSWTWATCPNLVASLEKPFNNNEQTNTTENNNGAQVCKFLVVHLSDISCPENTVTWILHRTLSIPTPTPQHTQSFSKLSPTLMNYAQKLLFEQDSNGNVSTETST